MMVIRFGLFVLLILAVTTADAAGSRIYRTVDEQGNVVFTDIPPREDEESEQVVIENPNSFDAQEAAPETDQWIVETPEASAEPEFSYSVLEVASPQNDESIRENAGNVMIIGNISPNLRPGDTVRLIMDGAVVQEGRQSTFELTNVDRGTHLVALDIIDSEGKVLIRSSGITFHLMRVHL